ncbi:unnamed protein product [Schistosoma turkestanicum]|nr:unnamed protein product [Schistosoma turkestanicum]
MMVEDLKEVPTRKGQTLIVKSLLSILRSIIDIFKDEIIDSDDVLRNLSFFTQIKILLKFMKIQSALMKTEYRLKNIVSQINPHSVNDLTEYLLCSAILIAKIFRRLLCEIIMGE